MRNHSYENDFDLHENETACRTFSYERFRTLTCFETEAQENSEMAYLPVPIYTPGWREAPVRVKHDLPKETT